MNVTELRKVLEKMELCGYGDTEVYGGFPTRLGYGVFSPRNITGVQTSTIFNKEVILVNLK